MSDSGQERPLETRVEDLFSNAVERQVAERRAVGRALEELGNLVRSLDERLGRLEEQDADRDTRLHGAVEGLQTRLDGLGGGLTDRLDSSVESLSAKVDRLAGGFSDFTDGAGAGQGDIAGLQRLVDERLAQLEAADSSRDRELQDAVATISDHVERLTSRMHDVLGEGVELLGRRQDEGHQALERAVLAAATEHNARVDPEEIAERLAGRLTTPELDVEDIAGRIAGRLTTPELDVEDLASRLQSRLSVPSIDVDRLVQDLTSRLAPPSIDVDLVASGVAERLAPPSIDVDALVDHLASRLATPALDVDELVDLLSVRLRPPTVDGEAIARAVVEGLPAAAPALDQDALARDLADTVADRVVQATPPLDIGLIASAVAGRMEVPSALQVASAVDASIRDGLVSVVDEIRDEVDRVRLELGGIREEVGVSTSGLQPLATRVSSELDDLADALASMRTDLRSATRDRDDQDQALATEIGARVDGVVLERLAGLQQLLDEQTIGAGILRSDVREAFDGLRGRVDEMAGDLETVRAVRDSIAAQSGRLDQLAAELPSGQASVLEAVERLTSDLPAATAAGLGEVHDRLDRLSTDLPEASRGATEELGERVGGLVRDLAVELGEALATVAERVERAEAQTATNLAGVGDQVGELSTAVESVQAQGVRNAQDLGLQADSMATMAGDLSGLGEVVGRVLADMQLALRADQDVAMDRVQAQLDRSQAQLEVGQEKVDLATERLGREASGALARIDQAVETVVGASDGLRERLESVLDEVAGMVRLDAEDARDEVIAAGARLDLLFDRLAGFERAIVEHLIARDNQLAQERRLVTQSVVEQLGGNLGKRERKKLAGKLEAPAEQLAPLEPLEVPPLVTPEPGSRDLDVEVIPRTRAGQAGGRRGRARTSTSADLPAEVTPAEVASAAPAKKKKVDRKAPAKKKKVDRKAPAKKAVAKKAVAKKAVAKKAAAVTPVSSAPVRKVGGKKPATGKRKVSTGAAAVKKAPATRKAASTNRTAITRDDLIAVKGLGPAKADALLAAFGDPRAVVAASVADLSAVPGISARLAELVRRELGPRAL